MLSCYCQLSSSVIFRQYGVSQSECKIDRPRPGLSRVSPRPHTKALGTRLTYCTNLVPRACDPREGIEGSGIIRYRKPRILAKIELRIPFQWPIRFLPETDYPRAFVSFPRIAGSGNEIGTAREIRSAVFICFILSSIVLLISQNVCDYCRLSQQNIFVISCERRG